MKIARFQILLQVGEIFLDTDVIVTGNLDELRRSYDIVLGAESLTSQGSAGMIASRESRFLKRWFQEYRAYKDESGGLNAVLVPLALWRSFPEEDNVVPLVLDRPNWWERDVLHHGSFDWSEHLTVHLSAGTSSTGRGRWPSSPCWRRVTAKSHGLFCGEVPKKLMLDSGFYILILTRSNFTTISYKTENFFLIISSVFNVLLI